MKQLSAEYPDYLNVLEVQQDANIGLQFSPIRVSGSTETPRLRVKAPRCEAG